MHVDIRPLSSTGRTRPSRPRRVRPSRRSRAPGLLILLLSLMALALASCDRSSDPSDGPRAATAAVDDVERYVRTSDAGHFSVRIEPRDGKAPLRRLHEWIVSVENGSGEVVRPTRLALAAGMAQHGHGMETRPRVVEVLPDGRHVVGGMKFNMAGAWQVRVEIVDGSTADLARFDIVVGP